MKYYKITFLTEAKKVFEDSTPAKNILGAISNFQELWGDYEIIKIEKVQ